jgi:competence protein ComEC
MRLLIVAVLLSSAVVFAAVETKTLDIYFIDVEGGQATLVVSPAGESMLIDAGYPGRHGRDPDRIVAAAFDARISRLDYLLVTHLHEDHDGGAAEVARRLPVGTFIDYGEPLQTEPDVVAAFATYVEARRRGAHLIPKPGDRLPMRGLEVTVVSAGGATLAAPLRGAGEANPACAPVDPREWRNNENPRSIGVHMRWGAFTFLDLGDLMTTKLSDLVCPNNLLGTSDVYLVAHHANNDSNVPAFLAAVRPRVAVVNNGAYKGGAAGALDGLHRFPSIEDVWQLHRAGNEAVQNSDDALIANLADGEQDLAHWIKLSAREDGSFSVTNGRTGERKEYGRVARRSNSSE